MDLWFAVHKLAKFSSNPGKLHSEGLVQLLIYIRDNKNLCLRYSSKIGDEHLSNLLIQARINTENQLMVIYDSSWQDCKDNDRNTGAYNVFYQGIPINIYTHVTDPVSQIQC